MTHREAKKIPVLFMAEDRMSGYTMLVRLALLQTRLPVRNRGSGANGVRLVEVTQAQVHQRVICCLLRDQMCMHVCMWLGDGIHRLCVEGPVEVCKC